MKKIYIVGIGPGDLCQMTNEAVSAIEESEAVVGYTKYIDLIKDLTVNKKIYMSGMKQEKERCQKAIEFANEGKTTSVVSSGDAGIYGMAGLIYELAEQYPDIEIKVIPGITAAVSAAAVLGAPIMHDFAVISLSDLLTPWEKIQKRIEMVAKADFIVCLYNPGSMKRADYLKKACEYMLMYKSEYTQCGWVKNISREGQKSGICTLRELSDFKADMFTTIIIGNSDTKAVNGKLVTPRGYDIK